MTGQTDNMVQQELPLALVRGERFVDKPKDLYIPKQAMEVHLKEFEGPLDLLLYLIRKQKFDIVDLPIAPITSQYLSYITSFEQQGIELAAEYLLMAATLAEIKSRLLLPKPELEEDEIDPRAELVRRLQEYELMKLASEQILSLPQVGRDVYLSEVALADESIKEVAEDEIDLEQLIQAFQQVLSRQAAYEHHHIAREAISTKERIDAMLEQLTSAHDHRLSFIDLLDKTQGRQGAVVSFLAMLELLKSGQLALDELAPNDKTVADTLFLRLVA